MNLQIPIQNIRKVGGGVSIFGSIPSTRFLKSLAVEWTSFCRSIGESGRRGPVGSIPQVVDDGSMISIQATDDDDETCAKAQVGALRCFKLSVDESSGRLDEVALYDGAEEAKGPKLYKRFTTMTKGRISPEVMKLLAGMGFDEYGFSKDDRINSALSTRSDGRGAVKPGQNAAGAGKTR